jgi:hypothetical protein
VRGVKRDERRDKSYESKEGREERREKTGEKR